MCVLFVSTFSVQLYCILAYLHACSFIQARIRLVTMRFVLMALMPDDLKVVIRSTISGTKLEYYYYHAYCDHIAATTPVS